MSHSRWCREEPLVSKEPRLSGDAVALILHVHAQPGARTSAIAGIHGDALKIRLAGPPVDGKANAELIRYLADAFGVPLRAVVLLRGETGRRKTVRVEAPTRRPDREWARDE